MHRARVLQPTLERLVRKEMVKMYYMLANLVKKGKRCSQIFEDNPETGSLVSGVNTEFLVDHQEPLAALRWIQENGGSWPLGDLPEGHEFLLLFESSRRRRSRSLPGR